MITLRLKQLLPALPEATQEIFDTLSTGGENWSDTVSTSKPDAAFISGNWYDSRKVRVVSELIATGRASVVYITGGIGRLTSQEVVDKGGEHSAMAEALQNAGVPPDVLRVVPDCSAKHTGDNCDNLIRMVTQDGGVSTLYLVEESFLMRYVLLVSPCPSVSLSFDLVCQSCLLYPPRTTEVT